LVILNSDLLVKALKVDSSHAASEDRRVSNGLETCHF